VLKKRKRIETLISVVGALTIPVVVVSGIPIQVVSSPEVNFWHLLITIFLVSMLIAAFLVFWQYVPYIQPTESSPGLGLTSGPDENAQPCRQQHQKQQIDYAGDQEYNTTVGPGVTPYRSRARPNPTLLLTGLRSVRRDLPADCSIAVDKPPPGKRVSYGAVDIETPLASRPL